MRRTTPPTSDLSERLAIEGLGGGSIPRDGLFRRMCVALRHRWLDWRLAEGADPASSAMLTLRARQLTSRLERDKLAYSIIDRVAQADHPRRLRLTAGPAIESVRAARTELRRIADLLLDPGPVYVRGVALGWALLRDPDSPLYDGSEAGSAWYWARLTSEALEGHI